MSRFASDATRSPLGHWVFVEQYSGRETTGIVIARRESVLIETRTEDRPPFVRCIEGDVMIKGSMGEWYGDYASEEVMVTIWALAGRRAKLQWRDGVINDWLLDLTRA